MMKAITFGISLAMTHRIRRFMLVLHVTSSVGWLGAVIAYLVLALTGLNTSDNQLLRAAYLSTDLVGWYVIAPLSVAALVTGLIQSLGTDWGLFRHYWISMKFFLAAFGIIILLFHMRKVSEVARIAADAMAYPSDFRTLRLSLVVHAAGGLFILLTATVLSLYKPWGRTAYGLRKQQERAAGGTAIPQSNAQAWRYGALAVAALALFFAVLHFAGGGIRHH